MNDQLPGQKELMEKFGASMGTVVKALDELRREGLVRTLPGKGTFVVRKPGQPSGEFVTLMKRLDEQAAEVRQLRERVERVERQQQ
jgi:DNA-binding GntR family transcriptional regulator